MEFYSPKQDELMHHGVKGMKWGVRKKPFRHHKITNSEVKKLAKATYDNDPNMKSVIVPGAKRNHEDYRRFKTEVSRDELESLHIQAARSRAKHLYADKSTTKQIIDTAKEENSKWTDESLSNYETFEAYLTKRYGSHAPLEYRINDERSRNFIESRSDEMARKVLNSQYDKPLYDDKGHRVHNMTVGKRFVQIYESSALRDSDANNELRK